MRVLLIIPPFYRLMGSHHDGISLGVAYIAAFLLQKGFEVKVYNADYSGSTEYANLVGLITNYDNYKTVLNNPDHPIWHEISSTVRTWIPDVVGIAMYTAAFKSAQNVAAVCREINPDVKIVVGGFHPTVDPEGVMECELFDYAIRGEGEYPLWQLLKGDEPKSIEGLSFRHSSQVIHNQPAGFIGDLDTLPFPLRNPGFYLNPSRGVDWGGLTTSRGCPFACTFCASPSFWGRRVRFRSLENILDEIAFLYENLGVDTLHFQDDTFTLKRDRVVALCTEILARQWHLKWVCNARVDRVDRELLTLMKKAGCVHVKVGVESGNDETLKLIRKNITTSAVQKAVADIKSVGLSFTTYFVIGFPNENNAMIRQTIEFARSLGADSYTLSILTPYFGTELWDVYVSSGRDLDREPWEYFFHQSRDMLLVQDIDAETVAEFFSLSECNKMRKV